MNIQTPTHRRRYDVGTPEAVAGSAPSEVELSDLTPQRWMGIVRSQAVPWEILRLGAVQCWGQVRWI
jgi:hypothetical protein